MAAIDALGIHLPPALYWLLRTSVSAAGIALIILAAQFIFGRWLSPGWRYRLWGLVVLRLVLPALPASPMSAWNLDLLTPARKLLARTTRVPVNPTSEQLPAARPSPESGNVSQPRVTVSYEAPPLAPRVVAMKSATPDAAPQGRSPVVLPVVLTGIWLGGAMILLSRLIGANIKLARRLRRARPMTDPAVLARLEECCRIARVSRPPPLLITDAVRAPAAAGFRHPRILLPPGLFDTLPADEQRLILLHELAHIRCRDVAANCALAMLEMIHWFNPLIRLAFARLRADREVVRDGMVLRLLSRDELPVAADRYGQTLLKLTEYLAGGRPCVAAAAGAAGIVRLPPAWMPAIFANRSGLQRRLQMITRFSDSTRRFNLAGPVLVLVLASCTLTRAKDPKPVPAPAEPAVPTATTQPGETVAHMIGNSRELTSQGKYGDALALVDQILVRDPKNYYAVGVRPLLADKALFRQQQESAARSPFNAYREEPNVPEPDPAVMAQLDRKLPELSFDAVGLSDVIDFLRDVSGANIFVNWKSLEAANIDRNTPVTARLRNIKFSKALSIILDSVGGGKVKLGYTVDNGVITISTADDLSKNVIVHVYDIRDLLIIVPDYDPKDGGPTIVPATSPATTQPAHPEAAQKPGNTTALLREELVKSILKLIEDTVATDTWKDNGGSVGALRELQGQLIVTQTPENHREIVNLLEQLRETRGIQVYVETRFISCDEQVVKTLMAGWQKNGAGPTSRPVLVTQPATRPSRPVTGMYLDDAQVKQFTQTTLNTPGSRVVAAPRLLLFNDQRAYVMVGTSRAYVRDYSTIRTAAGDIRYEPVTATAEDGLLMDVLATAGADRKFVTLTLRPRVSALAGMKHSPWPGRPAGSNLVVDEPLIRTSELQTTVSIPDGGTLLLGGLEDPGIGGDATATQPAEPAHHLRGLFLLVKPSLIIQREDAKPFPPDDKPAGRK